MKDTTNNPDSSLDRNDSKGSTLTTDFIIRQVEKGTGMSYAQLKRRYFDQWLFHIALKYVTTTKKAISVAFNIPIESCCRYKRNLEEGGLLVQSANKGICPVTKYHAHILSTDPSKFDDLLKFKGD